MSETAKIKYVYAEIFILALNILINKRGQNVKIPRHKNNECTIYKLGEEIVPKKENSVGLVAITLLGSNRPIVILVKIAEKINIVL